MKQTFKQFMAEIALANPDDEAEGTIGWYIVNVKDPKNPTEAAGPYDTMGEANRNASPQKFKWYNTSDYEVMHGWIGDDNDFHELEED